MNRQNTLAQDLSIPVIAIDGGAATGKGTTRMGVAKELGFHELDSGVLYRALGLVCQTKGITDDTSRAAEAERLDIVVHGDQIFLDGKNRTSDIRTGEAGKLASEVAHIPAVRENLRHLQIRMRKAPGLVADGRDMGYIFDHAHRFFLVADIEERARRRQKEFSEKGQPADYDQILEDLKRRDARDTNRGASPLIRHPEAVEIDTTHMAPREVIDLVIKTYHRKPASVSAEALI